MREKSLLTVWGLFLVGLVVALLPLDVTLAKDDVIKLKFANFFPPPAKQSKICEQFIGDLEMRSKGRIKVRYFKGGSMLKGPGMFQGIESGIADIGYSHISYTPGRMPVTDAAGLPLGSPSAWVSSHSLNDFYFNFRPKEWDSVKVLWLSACGPANILTKKPVNKLEDLKGLTIRGLGIGGDFLKALGCTAAPTPMVEVYDAISKGVIDGTMAVYESLKAFRFAEVAKYLTLSWQVGPGLPFYVAMNKNSYNKLPPDLKELFDNLCGEYREQFALVWNQVEIDGKKFGKEKGMTYIELSDEEVSRWKKAVEPVIDDYVKRMMGKGFAESEIRGWISYLRERIDYYTKMQIEYAIPSPTGPAAMRPENIGK